jgi:hypothetical protein
VVVGKESKYRVIYRLVNTVYVLGITSADLDDVDSNIFACACMVNQAVSVVVAACKGVDVTPDKLSRKYTEVSMELSDFRSSCIYLMVYQSFLDVPEIHTFIHISLW